MVYFFIKFCILRLIHFNIVQPLVFKTMTRFAEHKLGQSRILFVEMLITLEPHGIQGVIEKFVDYPYNVLIICRIKVKLKMNFD